MQAPTPKVKQGARRYGWHSPGDCEIVLVQTGACLFLQEEMAARASETHTPALLAVVLSGWGGSRPGSGDNGGPARCCPMLSPAPGPAGGDEQSYSYGCFSGPFYLG